MSRLGRSAAVVIGLAGLLVVPGLQAAHAEDEVGDERPLICALARARTCTALACTQQTLADFGLPPFFRIDLRARSIAGLVDEPVPLAIEHMEEEDDVLVLLGSDEGLGYSMSIARDSGMFTLSFTGNEVIFLFDGACTVRH